MKKNFKLLISQLDMFGQCRKYGVSIWQCPQFLFLIMGSAIIIAMVATYYIGIFFNNDPEAVALVVIALVAILLAISFIIVQSFDKLAEANRLKTEFVSIVSHQIRSPLTNLKWIVELLTSGILGKIDGKQAEYFKILKENLERMQTLVSELLTVSRIESGKIIFKKEEFSIENLIRDLVEESKPIAKSSNIKVELNIADNIPRVYGDPFQVLQAVENLLYNSLRYTDFATDEIAKTKGGGKVFIKVNVDGKFVFCEIKDNGIGIPKDDQKYIFQKFFRAENVRRYQANGSGLGLYIAKNIIEKSGGKIGFESKEGDGTTFWFKFPILYKK